MNVTMPSHQRGFDLGQFLILAFLLVIVSILGLKIVPAYMENETIKNIFVKIAQDPDMQSATPYDIRVAFEKRASIEGVKAINTQAINIDSRNGSLYLSASYAIKIPLVSNASLYLEFEPSSAK